MGRDEIASVFFCLNGDIWGKNYIQKCSFSSPLSFIRLLSKLLIMYLIGCRDAKRVNFRANF